jgi:threonine dehydrogenase-like Zn-dependent dehydrogenase
VFKELDSLGSRTGTDVDFREVIRFLESGKFPSTDIISKTVSFDEAGAALKTWSENPGSITKIHVQMQK